MRKAVIVSLTLILSLSGLSWPGHSGREIVHAQAQQEPPQLTRIGPDTITAGSPTFTLRLQGKKFAEGAKVEFDGVQLASSRVSSKGKLLLAEVDQSLIAATGTHTVRAVNPDGMASSSSTLTVVEKDPELNIRLEGNAAQEDIGLDFIIEISGEGFNDESEAIIYGRSSPNTEFLSKNRLRVQIPSKFTNDPGRIPIMVRNRGGRLSNADIFFIVTRPVRIGSFEPETLTVGSEPVELKVRGNDFKPDARILVNDIPLETTSPKQNQLVAMIPASLLAAPGVLTIAVEQGGIQSPDEFLVVAPDEGPFIFAIAPARIRIGEKKESIELTGANFMDEVKVLIDGQEAKVRDANRRRLTVAISDELLMAPGAHTIQVKDKDDKLSNLGSFEVVTDVEVTTFAGEKFGFNPDEQCVSAEEASFRRPRRITLAPDGLLYVTDQQNHAIRTIDPATGEVCTIAGTGLSGYTDSGDSPNFENFEPSFSYPNGVAVAADGTIYVTENGNNVIRRILRTGGTATLETLAGISNPIDEKSKQKEFNATRIGRDGFRDGVATDAAFRSPDEIVVAPDGSLYVADPNNHSIRRIVFNGGQVVVETVAGNGVPGFADGDAAKARFNKPTGIVLSLDGNFLYVADTSNDRVRRINLQTRKVDTLAGVGDTGGVDGPAMSASFSGPIGLAVDADGVVFVSEFLGNRIRRIDPAGNVTTLAGDDATKFRDGPGVRATFNQPRGLAIDRAPGILYVADYENMRIRAIALR